ncbi:hypothetical protein [Novosphingobium album (ex Liu et al. 2023)]|uniref:Uncharacterized protein n=1 Tax=Novosphingobium album (ex Liu et al. 2023) TaxID=3031130 RepID=A0ABT5WPQ4_9SPHN|nr:hypothetical protein [Novosphingobium album (ex Liu et al. 2023)]MDE8650923.1 hypothetical protein [Novosphingobium album (ex Liu et al. 2023)]
MTARGTPSVLFRLWLAVLLAAIGLQAAEPMRAPLERFRGSAFSAATSDVALASPRPAEAAKAQAPHMPASAIRPAPLRAVPLTAFVLPGQPRPRPEARGPPPRHRADRLPAPRGPPLS